MNKNKLIVLLVLLIAVVGLTIGPVSAKVIKIKTKEKKSVVKKSGKYYVATYKESNNNKAIVVVGVYKKKGKKWKELKGNKFSTKIHFKYDGESYVTTKWFKPNKKYGHQHIDSEGTVWSEKGKIKKFQYITASSNIKIGNIDVKC